MGLRSVTRLPSCTCKLTPEPIVGSLIRLIPPYAAQHTRSGSDVTGTGLPKRRVASLASATSAPKVFAGCVKCTAPLMLNLLYGLYWPASKVWSPSLGLLQVTFLGKIRSAI